MAIIQCTTEEVCAVLGGAPNAIYDNCVRDNGCTLGEYLDRYRELGKMSLRRAQYKAAVRDGNTTMLRWLGIQYLDQSPEVVVMHRAPPGTPATDAPQPPTPPSGFAIRGLEGPTPSASENSSERAKAEVPADPNVIPTTGRTIG